MVEYASGSRSCLFFILLLSTTLSSKVPEPSCNSLKGKLFDIPISLYETQNYNMNDYFSGYNLNITIPKKPDFVYIREKITKIKTAEKTQPGLINYNLMHEGNQWGNTLITISVEEDSTRLRWGASELNSSSIPDLSQDLIVETDPRIYCYDAVWLRAQMIALVDCSLSSFIGLQNIFIYVNITSKTVIAKIKNDMYLPFASIQYRKIDVYTKDNYNYLIRAYFGQYVDERHRSNTYAEIISINNPLKPFTIRVIDNTFLGQQQLSIYDIQIYLGGIYILDNYSGVIKLNLLKTQKFEVTGRYRTHSGFTKLGVFSNNLDNQLLLVLAHDHAIFEVDWYNQDKPEIIAKYSIPDNAQIHNLWVNRQYVVIQLAADLTNNQGQIQSIQSTYVFSRGTRTYLNAYAAIPHLNKHAFVDFSLDNSQILTIDTQRMIVFQLSIPTVSLMPQNPDLINKQFIFNVLSESKNQYTNTTQSCQINFKFVVVPVDSCALWPTGLHLPETYFANYPGYLYIPLDRYVYGSNISWGIKDDYDASTPVYYILQQNDTRLYWDKAPTVSKYVYLIQEQYDSLQEIDIYLYTQDYNNATHFSRCITVPKTDQVHCVETGFMAHINFRIADMTANRFRYYEGIYLHFAAIIYQDLQNQLFVYNVERLGVQEIRPITFPAGAQGVIASIQFVGHYLVVVLKYMKQIVFFDMIKCYDDQENQCQQIYRITPMDMTRIGVNDFSPEKIYSSDFHPKVLFVQCLDHVLILDVASTGIIKLAEVSSPATKELGFPKWKMAIARSQLILVNPPNTIEEHDLSQLYSMKDVQMTKVFPTYSYVIPDNFDLDFSDQGNLVYITGIDPKLPSDKNCIIMVYRTGFPAVSSFYDVFNLQVKYEEVLIDASGRFGDYVAVAYGNKLQIFRQYENPLLVFQNSYQDYSFNISFTNDPKGRWYYMSKSTVKIANYPENIVTNDTKLYDTSFLTNSINYDKYNPKVVTLDDKAWFNGSVINYTISNCNQCNDKIKIINHVHYERDLLNLDTEDLGNLDMEDYVYSDDGGLIQQFQSIIKMKQDGSIDQFITFPSIFDGEVCIDIEHSLYYDFTLSACTQGDQVYLYNTVYTASKPFVNGPYYSSAKHVTSLQVKEELMILVDVDEDFSKFDREGGVIIYAINHDYSEPEIFDELQFIDTTDLIAAKGWPGGPCFIGNAHFSFVNITNSYRLVITELNNGIFVVDFTWVKGRKNVQILRIEYLDLKEELLRINFPLPNEAFFTAIAINKESLDLITNYWQTELIVSTSNFHSFQVNMYTDNKIGSVVAHSIAKIFHRYGFYENQNCIKTFGGYFAIAQKLPNYLQFLNPYSRMVLSVYNTDDHQTLNSTTKMKTLSQSQDYARPNIPISYLLGGYSFPKGKVAFDWNFTFVNNSTNPFSRIGLFALSNTDRHIQQFSVHEKLIVETQPGISKNQQPKLRVANDYYQTDIPFKIIVTPTPDSDTEPHPTPDPGPHPTPDPGPHPGPKPNPPHPDDIILPVWAIVVISVGSVAVSIIGFVLYKKFGKGKKNEQLNKESGETEKTLLADQ